MSTNLKSTEAKVTERALSDNDLYYLRTIHRRLLEFKSALADTAAFTLQGDAFADEINWLDCFIDEHTRAAAIRKGGQSNE